MGGNYNANVFFEGNVNSANVFNNVMLMTSSTSGQLANGAWNGYGNTVNVFNNTFLGDGSSNQNYKIGGIVTGPSITYQNNALTDAAMVSFDGTGNYPVHCPYTSPQGSVTCTTLTNGSYTLKTNGFFAPATFGNGMGTVTNGFYNFNSSGYNSFETDMSSPADICRTNDTGSPLRA